MIVTTDLYINGGNFWAFGVLGFVILAFVGVGVWISEKPAVGVPLILVGIIGVGLSIWAGLATHEAEYNALVSQIHHAGFKDPIDINEQTFISGEKWCALKPIGDGDNATIFKIVCEK